jgi:hypothetical protein
MLLLILFDDKPGLFGFVLTAMISLSLASRHIVWN